MTFIYNGVHSIPHSQLHNLLSLCRIQVTWYFRVEGFFHKVVASPLRLPLVSSPSIFYFDSVSLILMTIIIILLLALKKMPALASMSGSY